MPERNELSIRMAPGRWFSLLTTSDMCPRRARVPAVPVAAQGGANTSLGSVTLSRGVTADGQPLAAGTYQVRLSSDMPKPAVGQSPEGERYVEFLRGGKVVGREVATVISDADAKAVDPEEPQPHPVAAE